MAQAIDAAKGHLVEVWDQALVIWATGGWAMIAIAVISLFLSAMGFHIWLKLRKETFRNVPEKTWRGWIDRPERRTGRLGDLLNFVLSGKSIKEVSEHFGQLSDSKGASFERDLKVMKICVSAAPLVGLLGTVTGMLSTFSALSTGSGGDQTMGMIAAGISEALITTETGLVIALPGLFFHHFLERKYDDYRLFLAHLETVCSQALHRRTRTVAKKQISALQELGTKLRRRFPKQTASWQLGTRDAELTNSKD